MFPLFERMPATLTHQIEPRPAACNRHIFSVIQWLNVVDSVYMLQKMVNEPIAKALISSHFKWNVADACELHYAFTYSFINFAWHKMESIHFKTCGSAKTSSHSIIIWFTVKRFPYIAKQFFAMRFFSSFSLEATWQPYDLYSWCVCCDAANCILTR